MYIALGIPPRNEPALATLERGEKGFLPDASDRNPDLIEVLSWDDGPVKTPERAGIIDCTRNDFEINKCVLKVRVLLKHLQAAWDESKTTRRDLYQLFPCGDGQQACKTTCPRITRYGRPWNPCSAT